jgi:GNAT superfamily N-acetyltransferase
VTPGERQIDMQVEIPALTTSARARITRVHTLDNPVWHALTGPQQTVAEHAGLASRYLPDVSVFSALPDDASPDAWGALRELVGPGGSVVVARREVNAPEGWTVHFEQPCRQMWLPESVPTTEDAGDDSRVKIEALGAADVPAMLALVERTRPGPFLVRTLELGSYLGVRDADALVAMAGERMHPPGFTEVSAVCTDATHRGRGLASTLVRALVQAIRTRAETPFLHLTLQNEGAHRVYAALGFETRATLSVVGLRAPS